MDSIQSTGQAQYNITCHTINPKDVQYPEYWPSMVLVLITEVTLQCTYQSRKYSHNLEDKCHLEHTLMILTTHHL